ncbi:MAG: DUF5686 and carboxypeptidase regulatory-like domain-containing protein [Prevotellaceae bacterium]|jgi:hypothetical protein|nr:DUF5686 and carboxypeptidase regulatory-like domain-containing protein [Prevotellaceae bacterium]
MNRQMPVSSKSFFQPDIMRLIIMIFFKINKQKFAAKMGQIAFFLLLFSNNLTLFSQETLVVGQVLDEDHAPLAGVSVYFKGTYNGMLTNEEGYFMVRNNGSQTTVVFSLLGYKKQELKLQRGQNIGTEIIMKEEINWLPEIFVFPGENPALELLRKARSRRNANNIAKFADFSAVETAKNRIFLVNDSYATTRNKLWKHLLAGNLSTNDSVLLAPLFNSEDKFQINGKNRTLTERNIFETDKTADFFAQQLLQITGEQIDFYGNTLVIFGRSFVSPLANAANAYYKFYLADSAYVDGRKRYEVHFRSKNRKNLAFEGEILLDSASCAIWGIEAELPAQANINFVKNLNIKQLFEKNENNCFVKKSENFSVNLEYRMFADTVTSNSHLYITRTSNYQSENYNIKTDNLLTTEYPDDLLNKKMLALRADPLYRTALWLADIMLTGKAKAGKIDIGNVNNILRISEIEGWRIALPIQTNEDFLRNFELGGHIAYGFKNKEIKYSAFAKWKLPAKTKHLLSVGYFNDYRRIDYDYNDFSFREDPFAADDEGFESTVLSLRKAREMNPKREIFASISNDWNENIESHIFLRKNIFFNSECLPFYSKNNAINSFSVNSITLSTRFSFNQRTYEDHLQRIYLNTNKPIVYGTAEIGKYQINSLSDIYAKFTATLKHKVPLIFGNWTYLVRADYVAGAVPFPLLSYAHGNRTNDYNLFKFSMLKYLQFPADKNIQLHNELIFNGIIFNKIPLINRLNLREMLTLKVGYGMADNQKHAKILDFPDFMQKYDKPHAEFGAGITNILQFFSLQVICATPALPNNRWQWAARFYLSLGF